ncbi:hypothetical protein Tco_0174652 [Tanacetum coccineum]
MHGKNPLAGLTPKRNHIFEVFWMFHSTPCYSCHFSSMRMSLKCTMLSSGICVLSMDTFYRFKIDKKKRFKLTLEFFRDIFSICPRVPGRDFDPLPSEEDIVSFLRELGHTGEINSLNDVVVDKILNGL